MGQDGGRKGLPAGAGGPRGGAPGAGCRACTGRRRARAGSRAGSPGSGSPGQGGGAPCQGRLGAGAALGGGQAAQQGVLPEQVGQEGQRGQPVELDALAGMAIHALLNGLSGVVQAAFDGALGGLQGGCDVPDRHLVVVVHQHAQALGLRQRVDELHDHPPALVGIQGLVWDGLLVQGLEGVQQAVALLVLGDLHLPPRPPQGVAAVVRRHGAQPAPEGRRLLQGVQLGQHGDQDLLGGVQRVVLIAQHLFAVVEHPVLHRQHQGLLRLRVAGQAAGDQRDHFRLFHFSIFSDPSPNGYFTIHTIQSPSPCQSRGPGIGALS